MSTLEFNLPAPVYELVNKLPDLLGIFAEALCAAFPQIDPEFNNPPVAPKCKQELNYAKFLGLDDKSAFDPESYIND